MHHLSFRKRHMIQLKLAIFFNYSFCMERLHDERKDSQILRIDKCGEQGNRVEKTVLVS